MSFAAPFPGLPTRHVPRKLRDHHVLLYAGGAITVIVIAVTAIASLVRPQTNPCGYYCGPRVDTRLQAPTTYTNSRYGFQIDYPADKLSIADQAGDSVEFHSKAGPILFQVVSTSSPDTAVDDAVAALPSASFQDMQQVGPVRGAELGFVPATGRVYTATYVPSDGGGSGEVRVAVIAARQNGVTVVATMFSDYDADVAHAPYGLAGDSLFDYPISNFRFRGQQ
jgi:hypothetical protein